MPKFLGIGYLDFCVALCHPRNLILEKNTCGRSPVDPYLAAKPGES